MPAEIKSTSAVEVNMFSQPSGTVRGIVTAFMNRKGKRIRIAHATLLVAQEPTLTVEIPRKMAMEELLAALEVLKEFAKTVMSLDKRQA